MKTKLISLTFIALRALSSSLAAGGEKVALPDYTKGDPTPAKAKQDGNLGPTGLRGWMFCDHWVTTAARQISVTHGEKGSPAEEGLGKRDSSNAGFSLSAAAWPLVDHYPGHDFQTGLLSTCMHPLWEKDQQPKEECYIDIEGGLGWWRDTHFPTTTPKFIMGGVGPNVSVIANGPGYGAGTWDEERGLSGVAPLSPWLLIPLDGLNLKQGAQGELFGYGYLPLPLTDPKAPPARSCNPMPVDTSFLQDFPS